MKSDVTAWSAGRQTGKRVSKETLNNRALIETVSGLDVYRHTAEAYSRAYAALGIDIVNRVPTENAPEPTPEGTVRQHPEHTDYDLAPLGVFDTACRRRYACRDVDEVWSFDISSLRYADLVTPVPHPCNAADIANREQALGDIGLYYPMLYTTLFMWPVEVFGWEIFMSAAMEDPERFHTQILLPFARHSRALVAEMVRGSDTPLLFVHDDLCEARGPVFPPDWYERYIFPHYAEILAPARAAGRRVVLVADGNLTLFLPRLRDLGFDGLMFESPATPLEAVLSVFDRPDHLLVGGAETLTLTCGTPDAVKDMVRRAAALTADRPGFALASGGGLHDNIPFENLEAYFDARAECGFTPPDWRTRCRAGKSHLAPERHRASGVPAAYTKQNNKEHP